MKTSEFLAHLRSLKIRLSVEGGELKVSAPKGALTKELRDELVTRKAEIQHMLAPPAEELDDHLPIPPAPRTGPLPLSFTQQRLWFLDQMEPGLITYNMWSTCVLRGPLDLPALKEAFRRLVLRQEGLRTTFRDVDGVPSQVISAEPRFGWEEFPAVEPERTEWRYTRDELRTMLWERQEQPFDLAAGPMLRVTLIPLAKDECLIFVCIHHIVSDGISLGILFRELFEFYEAGTEQRDVRLPPLSIQYADFASWQRKYFEGPAFARRMDFWRENLKGELSPLELPADKPRPPVETHNGAVQYEWFPAETIAGLDRLVNQEQATLFPVLLAGYKAFLQRLTGESDILVGTAMGNRTRPEIEHLIGFFTNTLVLRTEVLSELSFHQLVQRVKETFLAAVEYQDTPFEKLVDELQPERNLAYSPIFQTFFVLDQDSGDSRNMGEVEFVPFELENHATRTDLVMHCFRGRDPRGADGLCVGVEYNTDLFEEATIGRWLDHFRVFLRELVTTPEAPIGHVPLLSEAEREQLLFGWNAPRAQYSPLPVHAQFEAQVDRTPEALALVFPGEAPDDDERRTYAELDAAANRLANHLRARGVEAGSLVGLCLGRSADMVVTQLAIQKAGAAYVPLDPAFPEDRLAYMCEDSGLTHAVTTRDVEELVPADVQRVRLDEEAAAIAACSAERPGLEVANTERMYVIYTSGSTGRPKGVELEHRSVSNFLYAMAREPGLAEGDGLLAVTTLSFDISILETMLPLVVGGTVWVAPKEATVEADRLMALLERVRPRVMQATPATWRMLLVSGWEGDADLRVLCGGEALPRELANELAPKVGELWNVYGPTEATVWSSVKRVEPGEGPVTIGHAIASTRLYVLDANHEPCPIGVPGELWIAGDGLARGYLNRPDLTAERFLPDAFVDEPGARMYRTGDLARWLPTRELECLGRVDNQVKVRGYRIELGEIESVLEDVPGVRQCVTIVREDTPGDQRIVAYLLGDAVEDAALKSAAGDKLPSYMVPSTFVWPAALPLTPNGKVDRKALLATPLERAAVAADAEHVAPRGELEEAVAEVWAEVLGLEQVSTNVNFFDLGGHSLLLAQVRAKLQGSFPGVTIIELFQHPTVSSLAAHLGARASAEGEDGSGEAGKRQAAGRQALMRRRRIRG